MEPDEALGAREAVCEREIRTRAYATRAYATGLRYGLTLRAYATGLTLPGLRYRAYATRA